jgi:DNA-binding MarR family transcriptional regulator
VADDRLDVAFSLLLRRMHESFHARLREHDLTPPQAIALRNLAEGPVAMGAMADRLQCDASNMTGIADRLEERGLVERRADPADRRRVVLALTDEGRAQLGHGDEVVGERLGRLLDRLEPAEAETVRCGLEALNRAMESFLAEKFGDGGPGR